MAKERSIGLRIDSELYEELERLAKADDRPVASVVRKAIIEYVQKMKASAKK